MKKNLFHVFIRFWIGLASLAAFLTGWILLGHAGKPVAANLGTGTQETPAGLAPLPTLAPLPSLKNNEGSALNQLPQQPSLQFAQPRFRTRGS